MSRWITRTRVRRQSGGQQGERPDRRDGGSRRQAPRRDCCCCIACPDFGSIRSPAQQALSMISAARPGLWGRSTCSCGRSARLGARPQQEAANEKWYFFSEFISSDGSSVQRQRIRKALRAGLNTYRETSQPVRVMSRPLQERTMNQCFRQSSAVVAASERSPMLHTPLGELAPTVAALARVSSAFGQRLLLASPAAFHAYVIHMHTLPQAWRNNPLATARHMLETSPRALLDAAMPDAPKILAGSALSRTRRRLLWYTIGVSRIVHSRMEQLSWRRGRSIAKRFQTCSRCRTSTR